jgi:hypothetical protein
MMQRQNSRFLQKKRERYQGAGPFRAGVSVALAGIMLATAPVAMAQEDWPYSAWDEPAAPNKTKPPEQATAQPLRPMTEAPRFGGAPRSGNPNASPGFFAPGTEGSSRSFATPPPVDRADLSPLDPVGAPDGSFGRTGKAPPFGPRSNNFSRPPAQAAPFANKMDPNTAVRLLDGLEAPKSHTLRRLQSKVLDSIDTADSGVAASKLDALYRLGFLREAADFRIPATYNRDGPDWARLALIRSRAKIALTGSKEACSDARDIIAQANALPTQDKHAAILMSGYCAALSGNSAAVSLAADVAREQAGFDPAGLAALESASQSSRPRISATTKLSPLSYRLLQKAGAGPEQLISAAADTPLLAAMSQDRNLPAASRIEVTERATNAAISPVATLASAYRGATGGSDIEQMRSGREANTGSPSQRRANMYLAAIHQQTPLRKVRLVRAFLDASRKSNNYQTALELMAAPVESLRPVPEIGWFSETAIEILLISGRHRQARDWLQLAEGSDPRGPQALVHWAALIDIADWETRSNRGRSLQSLERMALRGDFRPAELHRLATVLDALDYHVPIPLWEVASRTPQPSTGHLPATGLLSDLQKATSARDTTRAILLVLHAIGKDGPSGAHMIALGDSIRSLKRLGMEKEARLLGLEALFPEWPRAPRG